MSPAETDTPATRRGVTEQAAIAAIGSATRVLRLPTIRDRFEEIAAAAAQREQLAPAHRPGHRRRRGRLPGPLRARLQAGQRAC